MSNQMFSRHNYLTVDESIATDAAINMRDFRIQTLVYYEVENACPGCIDDLDMCYIKIFLEFR
jgi:hypothetical protein